MNQALAPAVGPDLPPTVCAEPLAIHAEPPTALAEPHTALAEPRTVRAEPHIVRAEPFDGLRTGLVEAGLQPPGGSEAHIAALQAELARLRHAIGHDLRAPVRHIVGFVQVIQEDHPELAQHPAAAHWATIAKAADNLNQQITNLLRAEPKL